ncbi:MAG: amidase family protein, partial [Planctomycetota bacterium]|nr:amidase family protein [Planctomycetota bacterium]
MTNSVSLVEKRLFSAVEAAEKIRLGEMTSFELTQQCIDRIKEVDPEVNAVVIPLFEQALEAARRMDELAAEDKYLGPLHGVPISVKECFFVADTDSCLGVDGLTNRPSEEDGRMVQRLKEAG